VTPAAINGQGFQGDGLKRARRVGKAHNKEIGLLSGGLDSSSTNGGGRRRPLLVNQMARMDQGERRPGPSISGNYGGGTLPLGNTELHDGWYNERDAAFKTRSAGKVIQQRSHPLSDATFHPPR